MFDRARQLLNGVSPDTRIHRVFPLKRAVQFFETKSLALVRPAMWDDPFENMLLNATLEFKDGTKASLEAIRDPWYGQCWTGQSESDAMWRIYSHDKTGVRLSTTVGKLFDAVCPTPDQWSSLEFFVGQVGYYGQGAIVDFLSQVTFVDVTFGGQTRDLAQTLLVKREAFAHEKEIRVLYFDSQKRHPGPVVSFAIDPATMIDEVMLDPRLPDAEFAKLSEDLRAVGYGGPITQSELYRLPPLTIRAE